MQTFYATFGVNHAFRKLYVEVIAADKEAANIIMHETFGNHWSMMYSVDQFESVMQYGLRRLCTLKYGRNHIDAENLPNAR